MANVDGAFGLRPLRKIDGQALDDVQVLVWAPSSYATNLFVGSPVKQALDSNAVAITDFLGADFKAGQIQEVTLAGDGEKIDYVITGFVVDASTENLATYRGTASTNRLMTAIPVPNVVFEIQADAGTGDQLRILGVSLDPKNNDVTAAYVNLEVVVNESHWYGVGTPAT